MAKYKSLQDYVRNSGKVRHAARTPAEARALLVKWTTIVDKTIDDFLNEMPKNGGVVRQMHAYDHPRQVGMSFESRAFLRPYMRNSMFEGSFGRVDVTQLYEYGYKVRSNWAKFFRNIENWGWRNGMHAIEQTVYFLAPQAAAEGVKITLG